MRVCASTAWVVICDLSTCEGCSGLMQLDYENTRQRLLLNLKEIAFNNDHSDHE